MATTPIWNIFDEELKRSRGELAERVYRRVAKLPKEQRGEAVRELIRAIAALAQGESVTVVRRA